MACGGCPVQRIVSGSGLKGESRPSLHCRSPSQFANYSLHPIEASTGTVCADRAMSGTARSKANEAPIRPVSLQAPAAKSRDSGYPIASSGVEDQDYLCKRSRSCGSSSDGPSVSALIRCAPHCGHRSAPDHAPQRGHLVCGRFVTSRAHDSPTGWNILY